MFRLDAATTATLAALTLNLDANETAAFARELEAIRTEVVEYDFPELKARAFIPLEPNVDPGAETLVWYEFQDVGIAEMIVNYADDLPSINALGSKQTSPIESHGVSYQYTTQDLRAWRKTGRPLDRRFPEAARKAVERRIEEVAALGHTARNVPGFLKNGNVPFVTTGINGGWTTATADEILEDLMTIAFAVWENSKGTHTADTMLLGTQAYKIVSTKIFSTYTGETVLSVFLRSQQMIKSVEHWIYCDTADAENNGERVVVYEKNPSNAALVIPLDFQSMPPQAKSLAFYVPCEGRIGGAVVYKPLSLAYADALLD